MCEISILYFQLSLQGVQVIRKTSSGSDQETIGIAENEN